MNEFKEIKITIHYRERNGGGEGSNDFNNLKELISFLQMKQKKKFAEALGFDQEKNRLK